MHICLAEGSLEQVTTIKKMGITVAHTDGRVNISTGQEMIR